MDPRTVEAVIANLASAGATASAWECSDSTTLLRERP